MKTSPLGGEGVGFHCVDVSNWILFFGEPWLMSWPSLDGHSGTHRLYASGGM